MFSSLLEANNELEIPHTKERNRQGFVSRPMFSSLSAVAHGEKNTEKRETGKVLGEFFLPPTMDPWPLRPIKASVSKGV